MIKHWNDVGKYISARKKDGIAEYSAGDDTPIYRWQRINVENNLINIFRLFPRNSKILEIGAGTGANVSLLKKLGYKTVDAYEPSEIMRKLLNENISNINVFSELKDIVKTYDIIFTCTVLQHIINDDDMNEVFGFINNINPQRVIFIEEITKKNIEEDTWIGRPLNYYLNIMTGYKVVTIKQVDFPFIHIARNISSLFGFLQKREGAPISLYQKYCEKILIKLKKYIPSDSQGLHMMYFELTNNHDKKCK